MSTDVSADADVAAVDPQAHDEAPHAQLSSTPSLSPAPPTSLAPTALLRLLWLASPALPVGGFSYSEGLEAALDLGLANDEAGVQRLLLDQLHLVQARSELPLVHASFVAWQAIDLVRVNALQTWALATRESSELRQQTLQMGRSLADWLKQRQPDDARVRALADLSPAPCWPIACALAAVHTGASAQQALHTLAFGWAENMVQAAVKAVPLGQSAGQRLLDALVEAIPAAVALAMAMDPTDDIARIAYAPGFTLLSARHETQYSRLFRS